MEYPNVYYQELAYRIIKDTSLKLKDGEVCFYEGPAKSFKTTVTTKEGKPKNKFGFFWTPWFWGVSNKKTTEVITETRQDYYTGCLYITNMRVVFKCKVDAFDVLIPKIKEVKKYNNGVKFIVGRKEYKVMPTEYREVLHVFETINKAQDPKNNTPASVVTDRSYSSGQSDMRKQIDDKLAEDLKKYLVENPGVIQSDLYKQLTQYDKGEISNALYWWEKDGKIRREKSGRSYALYNEKL